MGEGEKGGVVVMIFRTNSPVDAAIIPSVNLVQLGKGTVEDS